MKKLLILGGGIVGLSSAFIASEQGWEVEILESNNEVGGLLKTFTIGNNQLEHFYHHFFTHDGELRWLLQKLNIEDKLEFNKASMGIFRHGNIYDFGSALDLIKFKPLSWLGILTFGLSSIYLGKFANWQKYENISAYEWFKKYTGNSVIDNIWGPMLNVKFGPYYKDIPLSWVVGRLAQRFNSRTSNGEELGYIKGSTQILLNALLNNAKFKITTNTLIQELIIENNQIKGVKTNKGLVLAGKVLSTLPTNIFTKFIEPHNKAYYEKLKEIDYFGAVCCIIAYPEKLGKHYWLNIADESYSFGGVIEHTNFISEHQYNNMHITYLSKYFDLNNSFAKMDNEEIKMIMLEDLKKLYPHFNKEKIIESHIFKTNYAAPICTLNFSQKVPNCKTPIQNLYIASMPHIYPDERSINNSIRISAEACKVIGVEKVNVPYGNSLSGQIGMNKI